MGSMNDHCLDAGKLEKGVKMPLFTPDGGISDDYIMVRWEWEDAPRVVLDEARRQLAKALIQITPDMSPAKKKAAIEKNKVATDALVLDSRCSQVISWSFSEKCTKTNVRKFLNQRPDIADRIGDTGANTKLFFTDSGKTS